MRDRDGRERRVGHLNLWQSAAVAVRGETLHVLVLVLTLCRVSADRHS